MRHEGCSKEELAAAMAAMETLLLGSDGYTRWDEPGKLLMGLAEEMEFPYQAVVDATWHLEDANRIGVYRTPGASRRCGAKVEQVFIPLAARAAMSEGAALG